MRTVPRQFEINKSVLLANLKKIKTSIAYIEEDLKDEKFNYNHCTHLQDDALMIVLSMDKYLLLQMMRDLDDPD
jgi:hypothetical protein